jgi:hypothetical protein
MARNIQRKSQGSHTIRKGKTGENRRRKVMGLKPKNGQKENWLSPGRNCQPVQPHSTPNGRTVCQVGKPCLGENRNSQGKPGETILTRKGSLGRKVKGTANF